MVSTTDFDSVSLGSSPSSPTKLTNMEEIEKKRYINITWLPGQEEWYGNSHKVFQISEEDFNKVVEKYNEMVKVAKEIKAT